MNAAFPPQMPQTTDECQASATEPDPAEANQIQETEREKSQPRSELMPHRPSQIMRRMDRLAQERWLRKIHPSKAAEEERDQILR